jgi:hypothetical protein
MSEIEERLQKLPEGERRIHDLLLTRLEAGLAHYGVWKINRDTRSMPGEALDEVIDCLHYCAAELLRLRDLGDSVVRYFCPKCMQWFSVCHHCSPACPTCAPVRGDPAPPEGAHISVHRNYEVDITAPNRTDPEHPDRLRHYCIGCCSWWDESECPRCGSALP